MSYTWDGNEVWREIAPKQFVRLDRVEVLAYLAQRDIILCWLKENKSILEGLINSADSPVRKT